MATLHRLVASQGAQLRLWGYTILATTLVWAAVPQTTTAAGSYKPGELIVMFDSTAQSTIEAVLSASRANQTAVGIAAFDSIGLAHQLQSIQASPQAEVNAFARRLYTLVFPVAADIPSIAAAYAKLPYIASAEPNYSLQASSDTTTKGGAVLLGPPDILATVAGSDTSLYRAGELLVLFSEEYPDVIEAALSASRARQTTIGIAAFDSIGVEWQLRSILSDPQADANAFARRLYKLTFSDAADIVTIGRAYSSLPYVVSAEPNFMVRADRADFDRNGRVDFADFFLFADVFGGTAEGEKAIFDIDLNGTIDFSDFILFAEAFRGENSK